MTKKARKKKRPESEYDQLARLIKEEGDGTREYIDERLSDEVGSARKDMNSQFALVHKELITITRRLDSIIQMQLDEHARRIKKLETAVFPR